MRAMSIQQYAVLAHLFAEKKPVSSGDFRRHFQECGTEYTPTGLSVLLAHMEKSGLLKKKAGQADPEKGERRDPNYWTPTKKGQEAFQNARKLLVKKKTEEKA